MARKTPEINSSSQADIAFLLLCFFLMTTSMDVDYGITRRLPPPVEQNDEDVKVKERNVMNVMVNKSDRLLVNGRPSDISQLKDLAKIVHDNHLTLTTMLVVGEAIDNRKGLSELYNKHFTHLFRKGDDRTEK